MFLNDVNLYRLLSTTCYTDDLISYKMSVIKIRSRSPHSYLTKSHDLACLKSSSFHISVIKLNKENRCFKPRNIIIPYDTLVHIKILKGVVYHMAPKCISNYVFLYYLCIKTEENVFVRIKDGTSRVPSS